METPFLGWLLCCGGAFLGSLTPTFFSKQGDKLVVIWFFSYLSIMLGTFITTLFVSFAENFVGIAILNDPDFAHNIDPTGIWSMIIGVIIPTTIVTILLRLHEKNMVKYVSMKEEN